MLSLHMEGFLINVGVMVLLGWALYLPMRAGQMNNSPIFAMAIAGYFAAFTIRDCHWNMPLAFIGAVVACFLVFGILALFLAELSGFVMAVATIALIFIVQTLIRNIEFLGGPAGFGFYPVMPHLLIITGICVLIAGVFLHRLSCSRIGRALEALDFDPDLAAGLGINIRRMRILVQLVSAVFGALAGILYAFNTGTLFPELFGFNLLLYGFTMVLVGGRTTMWGALLFAPILWGLPEFAPEEVGVWRNIIYSSIVIGLLVLSPQGVITKNTLRRLKHLLARGPRFLNNNSLEVQSVDHSDNP